MEFQLNWNNLILSLILFIILCYIYKKFIFPSVLHALMKSIHATLQNNIKKEAFKDAFEKVAISQTESSETDRPPLEILEIGIGTGENFKNYPENANISYLDKTDMFLPFLRESLKKENRDEQGVKLIVSSAENMAQIESNSKDVVVHTFVLCSVEDPYLVLNEIYRVLKPGGVCIFIEHSLDTENNMRKLFQTLIGPIWYFLIDCRFKPIKSILEAGNYNSLKIQFHRDKGFISSIINPYVYGIGTKTERID